MGELINLNRARKARARVAALATARQNRAAHGRTRAEVEAGRTQRAALERALDSARLDHPNWVLIENDGALFRGPARGVPMELWSMRDQAWRPYASDRAKGVEWGYLIDRETALSLMKPG